MLQIVTGMYFRPVELTNKLHRATLYSNLQSFRGQAIELTIARLLPSTNWTGVCTLTVEATERLEAVRLDGGREVLAATSGKQLVDEIAAVIAFALNVTCSRDHDLVHRLVSLRGEGEPQRGPASILRRTFDSHVVVSDEAVDDLAQFARALLALERKSYEAAMRAIRRIVDATTRVADDVSLAYMLLVAALESLAQSTEAPRPAWADLEESKRARIDAATEGLPIEHRERIETAVLANEHVALQRRFSAFVLAYVEEAFYRSEAVGALCPITATELPNALRQAYGIRSRNVHVLEELPPEVWMAAQRADTAHLGEHVVLSLEGLARLARHVVRQFVSRARKGVDPGFQYRSALPGIVRVRVAPQHWIFQADGFGPTSAPGYLNGMLDVLIEGLSGRSEAGLVDMSAVLDRIEATALGFSKSAQRLPLVAIHTLWNAFAPQQLRRKLKPRVAAQFKADMAELSMTAFAVRLLTSSVLDWPTENLVEIADARRSERILGRAVPLPPRIDAALDLIVAGRLLGEGRRRQGLDALARAVEGVPGDPQLIAFETAIRAGENPALKLDRFVLGLDDVLGHKAPLSGGKSMSARDAKKNRTSTTSMSTMTVKTRKSGSEEEIGAASPSQLIDAKIKDLNDWRGETLARVRSLIQEADPDVVEEWKWRGVPVWSHAGIICTGESYKAVVKLTFAKGASLADPSRLFNSSLEGNTRRAIDVREVDTIDQEAFKALIRAAVALNMSKQANARPIRSREPPESD